MTGGKAVTVAAVVKLAADLRRNAEQRRRSDPYYRGHEPTEAAARKLSNRIGPEAALQHMRREAADVDAEYRDQQRRSEQTRRDHDRLRADSLTELRRLRSKMNLLERIAAVRNELAVIPDAPAAQLGGPTISGTKEAPTPPRVADPLSRVDGILLRAVESAERVADEATGRIRTGASKPPADDVEQLRALAGMTPDEVARVNPALGAPSRIRTLRRAMSVDPETGEALRATGAAA